MNNNLPYQYFLSALDAWIAKKQEKKDPYQKELALNIGVGEPTISKYLKSRKEKIIPFNSQVAIAEHISGDYLSFLEKGKSIYEISNPIKLTTAQHRELVGKFVDQERGLRINSKLVYAEKIEHDSLDKIEQLIDIEIKDIEKRSGKESSRPSGTLGE